MDGYDLTRSMSTALAQVPPWDKPYEFRLGSDLVASLRHHFGRMLSQPAAESMGKMTFHGVRIVSVPEIPPGYMRLVVQTERDLERTRANGASYTPNNGRQ